MKYLTKLVSKLVIVAMVIALFIPAFAISTDEVPESIQELIDLGLLNSKKDDIGYIDADKNVSRMKAVVMQLKLLCRGKEALSVIGSGAENAVLSYIKANPDLGWTGSEDFDDAITEEEYYKILLSCLGYKQDLDFAQDDIIGFAQKIGLYVEHEAYGEFTGKDLSEATLSALKTTVKGSLKTLADFIAANNIKFARSAAKRGLLTSIADNIPGNLINNPGFENDLEGWALFGGSPSISSDDVYSGKKALVLNASNGGIKTVIQYKVQEGKQYKLSLYAKGRVRVLAALFDENGVWLNSYNSVIEGGTAENWVKLENIIPVNSSDAETFDVTFVPLDSSVKIDDVNLQIFDAPAYSVSYPDLDYLPGNLVRNPGFESNSGWIMFTGSVSWSTDIVHSGERALVLKKENGGARTYDVIKKEAGKQYRFSAWVYGKVNMIAALFGNDKSTVIDYKTIVNAGGQPGTWQKIENILIINNPDVGYFDVTFTPVDNEVIIDDVCVASEDMPQDPNLIMNPNFEDDTGWEVFSGELKWSTDIVRSGERALLLETANGGVKTINRFIPEAGKSYRVSAWLYGKANVISAQFTPGGINYETIVAAGGQTGTWQKVEAVYTITDPTVTEFDITFTPVDPSVIIDDVSMEIIDTPVTPPPSDNLVQNPGFEEDTGWTMFGDEPLSYNTVHGGNKALRLTTANGGVKTTDNITHTPGKTYSISAWVYGKTNLLSAQFTSSGGIDYAYLVNAGGQTGVWQKIEAVYTITNPDVLSFDITFTPADPSVLIDDVYVSLADDPASTNVINNPDMETDSGWAYFDSSPLAFDVVHSGNRSLLLEPGKGVKTTNAIRNEAGKTYVISAWVYGQANFISALYNQEGVPTGDYLYHAAPGGTPGTWQKLEAIIEISDPNIGYFDITFTSGSETVIVDDVTVEEKR